MNFFVIGGVTVSKSDPRFADELVLLLRTMESLGRDIVRKKHNLLVCSPFSGSADLAAVMGAASAGLDRSEPFVHFYIPDSPSVCKALSELTRSIPGLRVQEFISRGPTDLENEESRNHAWLLAQLCAVDRCHALIAIGGKATGPMSLLLPLAETRRKCIVPFRFLGGAAADCFERQRHQMQDKLGDRLHVLADPQQASEAVDLVHGLLADQRSKAPECQPRKFFLSYSKARPEEADFVETALRRRNLTVFRDERDFGAGRIVADEIDGYLCQSDIFISLWCKDYACSPWCYDEMALALRRHEEGRIVIWLLCLDETRIVPPKARPLIHYPAHTRHDLEGTLLKLLDQEPK